jgi:Uma2 family endonuclease
MATVKHKPKRWSRAEYDRMIDAGIFEPGQRVELIDGEIIAMTPQNGPHAMAVRLMQRALDAGFGVGFDVRSQLPLALGRKSEPEPDIVVVAGSPRDYPRHPTTALLVVEVADTSLAYDRKTKGPLFARAGIAEYWIVNLVDRIVEVYREPVETPGGWSYRLIARYGDGETLSPLARPGVVISVADLLP